MKQTVDQICSLIYGSHIYVCDTQHIGYLYQQCLASVTDIKTTLGDVKMVKNKMGYRFVLS